MKLSASRKHCRRFGIIIIVVVVVAGAFAYGAHWWTEARFIQSTDDAYVNGDVTVIAPHVSGYVAHIAIKDNQRIVAGQLLAQLDDQDYRAELEAAEANVRRHLASLTRLDAQRKLDEALIDEAEAVLKSRKATAEFTALKARRYRGLFAGHAVSTQDMQGARSESAVAAATVAAAQSSLEAARKRLAVVDAQINEQNAAIANAQARQKTAMLNVGYSKIYAPVDGYVGNRSVQEGSYVRPGTQMMAVVPAHGLWVDANFKEDQIADMRIGAPVRISADVDASTIWRGHVAGLAPATGAVFSIIPAENATGNFTKIVQRVPVRIELEDKASRLDVLRPGLSVTVHVDTRENRSRQP